MRFHIDWGKALHAILLFPINLPSPRNVRSAICQAGTLARRPITRQSLRLEVLSQNDGIAEDSAMITALYEVSGQRFDVNIIPHTREVTTLGELRAGAGVNIEIDVIARYIDRLMQPFADVRKDC